MNPLRKITEVSAAVLLRGASPQGFREYLLAQRPPGKVYAGYWEFPGGKVEHSESPHAALVRELQEELGITVADATPWIVREFDYPHAHVRLNFFRISRWQGIIAPLEHSGFAWCRIDTEPSVTPVLPANAPVLQALALPTRCAITCAEINGVDAELERLARALDRGLRLIQVRDKEFPAEAREQFARRVIASARPHGARVIINDDVEMARRTGADGVHLSSGALRDCLARPEGMQLVSASCHDAAELAKAAELGVDFALLGSVLPTATHPEARPLGWAGFKALAAGQPMPVFSLGGMRSGMLDEAMAHGAHGLAQMRGW